MQCNQVVNSRNELDFMPNLDLITIFQGVAKQLKRDATMHLEHTAPLYIINEESLKWRVRFETLLFKKKKGGGGENAVTQGRQILLRAV